MAADNPQPQIRLAQPADIPALNRLIDESVRGLQKDDYDPDQIEALLKYVYGVDSQLIEDGTYYAVEVAGQLAGSGGWSRRQTLFGGDQSKQADQDNLLHPAHDPAKIRAFFVHPAFARRGIGRLLMQTCEEAARQAGFRQLELMATLTGIALYSASGFSPLERVSVNLPDGVTVEFVKMSKVVG